MNVIVGKPYRRTPVFTETLKYMVLNPYWNVPYSIATQDKLPLLKANAAAEAKKGFEAKPQGSDTFVPVDVIDWKNVSARSFNYLLRQKPGDLNALGHVKFMLPNPNADLFARHAEPRAVCETRAQLQLWLCAAGETAAACRVAASARSSPGCQATRRIVGIARHDHH